MGQLPFGTSLDISVPFVHNIARVVHLLGALRQRQPRREASVRKATGLIKIAGLPNSIGVLKLYLEEGEEDAPYIFRVSAYLAVRAAIRPRRRLSHVSGRTRQRDDSPRPPLSY